ncbi:MAG: asparagine synthase (glutamine-hydrolyzing) [Nitrospirae bacterium]|nr:asparagine synthase (glutamine-hydrolyzing) [Nitrospirota bacterium]
MCAINGILTTQPAKRYASEIRLMNHILRHRGPDGEGVYEDNNVLLGHRRLSIIDLTEKASQPMSNAGKTLWIVFNGEIYNYKHLRTELVSRGYCFTSNSDTEVVLFGYEQWGTEVFKKLDGFFAVAIWDKTKKQLVLARDGFGIKPLFYYCDKKFLIFSSEMKALLITGLIERKVNRQSLSNYLSLFYVPSPETIVEGIRQLPPGSYIVFNKDLNTAGPRKFWDIADAINSTASAASATHRIYEQLRQEISDAVNSSLVSDVPVSLLLSSGMDSSIILTELKARKRFDVRTITIGFNEASYDERVLVKRLTTDMGFQNDSFVLPYADVPEIMQKMMYHLDCLNADPCVLAEYFYFKKTAENFKVTLAGSGNDELFAGYSTYYANTLRGRFDLVPMLVRKLMFRLSQYLPVSEKQYSFDYLAQKFTEGCLFEKEKSHYVWRSIFREGEKKQLLRDHVFNGRTIELDSYADTYGRYFDKTKNLMSFQQQTLYSDFYLFLIDNVNMQVDQLSMAFSVEVRPPFLAKRLAELAFMIPYELKLKGKQTKFCLRKAYENALPPYITKRKKHGLLSPLSFLFNKGRKQYMYDNLLTQQMAEYFNLPYINTLINSHLNREQNNSYKLFALLCFSYWNDIFIDKNTSLPC